MGVQPFRGELIQPVDLQAFFQMRFFRNRMPQNRRRLELRPTPLEELTALSRPLAGFRTPGKGTGKGVRKGGEEGKGIGGLAPWAQREIDASGTEHVLTVIYAVFTLAR